MNLFKLITAYAAFPYKYKTEFEKLISEKTENIF